MTKDNWPTNAELQAARQLLTQTLADEDAPLSDRVAAANGLMIAGYLEHNIAPDLEWLAESAHQMTPLEDDHA